MRERLLLLTIFAALSSLLVGQKIRSLNPNNETSFRGLSAVNDKVVWTCGTKGTVCLSTNGGKNWKQQQLVGYENSDFRSVHAFSDKKAILVTAGTPSAIVLTEDGGQRWTTVWRQEDSAYFLDAIAFWDEMRGVVLGDPIGGHLYLLETKDGGKTWNPMPGHAPHLLKNEAHFAASGTCLRALTGGQLWVATGGAASRILYSKDYGAHWQFITTPMISGEASKGVFSIAVKDSVNWVIVGGDYTNDTLRNDHVFYTIDGGKTWVKPQRSTGGYRSCVEYVNGTMLVATGPGGTDISRDGGDNWNSMSTSGYHSIRRALKGKKVFFSGGNGRVALLIYRLN
jgi:photosystem II stability/assembly factor-like uncharacterized protein